MNDCELCLTPDVCALRGACDIYPGTARHADSDRLDWVERRAMNGQIQIARSILRTGYEIAVLEPGKMDVNVYAGTLREAIDKARAGGGNV